MRNKICQRSKSCSEDGLREACREESICTTGNQEVDQGEEGRVEWCAEGSFHTAYRIVIHAGEVKVNVGFEHLQVRRGIPTESISAGKAARQHVILKHVIKADANGARQEYRDESQDECDEEYAPGKSI